jgi:hypothetical protein
MIQGVLACHLMPQNLLKTYSTPRSEASRIERELQPPINLVLDPKRCCLKSKTRTTRNWCLIKPSKKSRLLSKQRNTQKERYLRFLKAMVLSRETTTRPTASGWGRLKRTSLSCTDLAKFWNSTKNSSWSLRPPTGRSRRSWMLLIRSMDLRNKYLVRKLLRVTGENNNPD